MLSQIKKISNKQREAYLNSMNPNVPRLILSGAIRTGKTVFGGYGFIEYVINNSDEKYKYAIISQTYETAIENVVTGILNYLDAKGTAYEFKNKQIVIGKSKILIVGALNNNSFKKIQGATLKGAFIDEGALLNEYMLQTIDERTLSFKKDCKLIYTSNPEGSKEHWFYKKFISNTNKYKTINFKLLDNPIFDEEDVEEYKQSYPDYSFQKKILGEWIVSSGAIYPQQIKEIEEHYKYDYIVVGFDEGRVDASVSIAVGVKGDEFIVIDEYFYCEDNFDILDVKKGLTKWMNELTRFNCPIDAYFETTPGIMYSMMINDIKNLDVNITVHKVNKIKELYKSKTAIQERIDATNLLIFNNKIGIFKGVAPNLESSMKNAIYDKKGDRLDNGTYRVDPLDAFEYAIKEHVKDILQNYYNIVNKEE
ncbi:MAG: terminase large subunit domain-containing protein [Mycoplasmatales bacterium]